MGTMFRYSPLQGEHKEAERVMERATQAICSTHEPEPLQTQTS